MLVNQKLLIIFEDLLFGIEDSITSLFGRQRLIVKGLILTVIGLLIDSLLKVACVLVLLKD